MRLLSYKDAINEALKQEMARDPNIYIFGIGVPNHAKIFGTTEGLQEIFGETRCFDTPISEEAMTGFALGAAIRGLRPIHVHIRIDFLLLAMNQLVNMISSYSYSTGGKVPVPIVIRVIVGRGWGQGAQHSKSLHSYFTHIPGLKVIAPTSPYDVKGMLIEAIRDNNPVICIEHRWLYWAEEDVPSESYSIPLGAGRILREGNDLTIVATSWMNIEALKAAELMEKHGISIEIVDPRTLSPLDGKLIYESVKRTGHCIVADGDWVSSGFSAEVAALVSENCFNHLKSPVKRIGFSHTPCPTVRHLENEFYPNAGNIIKLIESILEIEPIDLSNEDFYSHERRFKGPL